MCCWFLVVFLEVFGNFVEIFGRGPGVPVCRYLSPLPAHLPLPKLSRRASFALFQRK